MSQDTEKRFWVELIVEIDPELEDSVCDFLISELKRGVIIEDKDEKTLMVKAYLSREDLESGALKAIETFLEELSRLHGDYLKVSWSADRIVEEDWHEGWKRYFKPIKIGKRLVVKPSWETYVPRPQELVIEIDPGRAFGVGTHPSTRLVLARMEELLSSGEYRPKQVLDIGTGSGILAIAAAKLGAESVLGIDIDPDAVDTARNNVHLNHVHNRVSISMTPVWELEGPYELILANLDRDTLLLLAKDISNLVARDGVLLLSGILRDQAQAIRDSYSKHGLKSTLCRSDQEEDEWVLMEFRRD